MATQDITKDTGTPDFLNSRSTQPIGLYASGAGYTTGANLSSSPTAIEIPLTARINANSNWTVNADTTNGYIGYSGLTRYFLINVTFDITTASGPGSTVQIKLQKKTGIVWADIDDSEMDRYLSGTLDTGVITIQGGISLATDNRLRLFITSDSDVPTYTFNHLQWTVIPLP